MLYCYKDNEEDSLKNRNILKNKYYLYLTEFFAGMGMMAVELGASRLMAPYFSSSQIVWTIIISTIMIAMALGNLYGGRSADKDPDPDRLYKRLLIAAVWIAAIPVLGRYIILGITGVLIVTISQNLLTAAGFIACIVIFVFPCFAWNRHTVADKIRAARDRGRFGGRPDCQRQHRRTARSREYDRQQYRDGSDQRKGKAYPHGRLRAG